MNNSQDKHQQPISDDQELAKALAGVNQQADDAAGLQFEETNTKPEMPEFSLPEPPTAPSDNSLPPTFPVADTPAPVASSSPSPSPLSVGDPNLETIKKDALNELRPLVDKLDVNPEEKFDTYLLLIRSTDDRDLIAPAHDAARSIQDEARRAQALLDIIKEIDYLSHPQQS